ncbi:glycosyltransferase [Stutzerimonas nitrititolerans]|uniref:glycosyltransferase n=1 Tax=Stutzerimonas nitrititolerans TaxID=2482751 RepID=UPI003F80CDC9
MIANGFPKVAVLLAAYNGMQWIEEQVSSVLNQQGVNVTLFVSVDLSTDGTDQWVQALANKSSNVIMLPYGERFGGAGANFFRIISEVNFGSYDFASFADQDDIWCLDKLNRACDILNGGQAGVYSSNVTAFWSNGCEELIDKAQPKLHLDHFFEAAGPGCTYVFKQEVMLQLQAFVRTLPDHVKKEVLHDWLSYAFCRERGYRWYIDPIPSVLYRQHADNVVGTNNNWVAYKKRFALIRTKSYRKRVESLVGTVAPQRLADVSSRFFLLKNIRQLRRRARDRYFLLFILLLGIY